MTRLFRPVTAALLLALWAPYAFGDLFFVSDSSASTLDATSTLHIEFTDGFAITYEVSYDSSVTLTAEDLMLLVEVETAADPTLPTFTYDDPSFPGFVETITVVETGGTVHTDTPDFSATGTFWSYWTTEPPARPTPWTSSSEGITTRSLSDGSFDGWIVGDGTTSPGIPANVPEPGSLALAGVAGLALYSRSRLQSRRRSST